MAEKKNLCAQIPTALHEQVCEAREAAGLTTAQYITNLLTEYYEMKKNGGNEIMANTNTRTMAFQAAEEPGVSPCETPEGGAGTQGLDVSRHFTAETLQNVYDLCGTRETGLLPWEIIGAAVYVQTGTPAEEISKDEWKDFVLLPTPESAGAISSLAICTVRENGEETQFYTPHFGQCGPQKLLDAAIARAGEAGTTAAEALQQMDHNLPEVESHVTANKAILGPGSRLAEKLSLLMPSSPITAAHIIMDADRGSVTIRMNPLWEKLRDERESGPPVQQKHSGRKRSSKHKNHPDR